MLSLCLLAALVAPPSGAWSIGILEGAGIVAARGSVSAQRLLVQVKDAEGRPVPSVTVVFRLPAEGPSGTFASGLRSESVLTDSDGKAYVQGIHWNTTPGKLDISVRAGNAEIAALAEISAQMPISRQQQAKTGRKKWVILAVVCGASAASLAAVGGHKSTAATAAPLVAVQPPPSIGTPVISIGKP